MQRASLFFQGYLQIEVYFDALEIIGYLQGDGQIDGSRRGRRRERSFAGILIGFYRDNIDGSGVFLLFIGEIDLGNLDV